MFSKATISGFLSILVLLAGSISNAMNAEEKVLFDFVKNTAEQTDPQIVDSLKTAIGEIATTEEPGFKKMSKQEFQTIFLTCAIGDVGLGVKGSYGACVSSNGQVYTLEIIGGGLAIGAKASLVMGFAKSSDGSVEGDYGQLGVGAAAKNIAAMFANRSRAAGVGFSLIYAYSDEKRDPESDRYLALAGPAFGLMVDLSYSIFRLKLKKD